MNDYHNRLCHWLTQDSYGSTKIHSRLYKSPKVLRNKNVSPIKLYTTLQLQDESKQRGIYGRP